MPAISAAGLPVESHGTDSAAGARATGPPATAWRRRALSGSHRASRHRNSACFPRRWRHHPGHRVRPPRVHARGMRDDFSLALTTVRTVWGYCATTRRLTAMSPSTSHAGRSPLPGTHDTLVPRSAPCGDWHSACACSGAPARRHSPSPCSGRVAAASPAPFSIARAPQTAMRFPRPAISAQCRQYPPAADGNSTWTGKSRWDKAWWTSAPAHR